MLAQETIEQLQHAPLDDRIQAIEVLLGTLKSDIPRSKPPAAMQKTFTVHTFDLGTDIHPDRDEMYMERGL